MCDSYGYNVDKNDEIHEHLRFGILEKQADGTCRALDHFRVDLDPYYFGSLVGYKKWKRNNVLMDIASEYFV